MTIEQTDFVGGNATILMSNRLKEVAYELEGLIGGDASVALFSASMKALKEKFGDEYFVPSVQRWLATVIEAEGAPTSYN